MLNSAKGSKESLGESWEFFVNFEHILGYNLIT